MNIGHFLIDGVFDAALQAKVLYVKVVHGWMRPFKEQLSDGHRWDIWEKKMRSQQAANAEPAALPPYRSSSSPMIVRYSAVCSLLDVEI